MSLGGDYSFNSRRNLLALVSKKDEWSYQLFDLSTFRIIRKAGCQPNHKGSRFSDSSHPYNVAH